MLAADAVAVFAGAHFADRVPMGLFRRLAAALFFLFGIVSLASAVWWR
jgi:putative Ca2+/H+ antiporter (TMEM165/GDT1 family)